MTPRATRTRRRPGGRDTDALIEPGWKGVGVPLANPRGPSVPATLDLTLGSYYAATALMGLLASQVDEPNKDWACRWAFKMGEKMAAEDRKRRRRKHGRR